MKRRRPIFMVLFLILAMFLSFACQIPSFETDDDSANLEATIVALQTEIAAQNTANENEAQPHSPDVQPTEAQADQPPAQGSTYRGFMVYENGQFKAYDFEGNLLGFNVPAGTSQYYGENEISIVSDAVYYSVFGDNSGVFRADAAGTQRLNFINNENPVSIVVSPDGSKIAWSVDIWGVDAPSTQLYVANMDGSGQQMIAEIPAPEQAEFWRVYHPYRWTEDGKLLYATGLTGIGGYILFWGYNGMYEYDFQSATSRVLVSDNERLGLCLSSISNNREMAAIVCDNNGTGVRVRNLNSGMETNYPVINEQGVAGSAVFSPDDTWLAYVVQTQNYDDERGKVVVVPVDARHAPIVIARYNGGTYEVEGWVDNETLLVTRSDFSANTSSVWLMSKDGETVRELVPGNFVGMLP